MTPSQQYAVTVSVPCEDGRGVDRAAIRERLQLTVPERVQRLVDELRLWSELCEAADIDLRALVDSKWAADLPPAEEAMDFLEEIRDELARP